MCGWLHSDAVECDLTFAGLIVMQNRLKPQTTPIIGTLLNANIRPVMITGRYMCKGITQSVYSTHITVCLV